MAQLQFPFQTPIARRRRLVDPRFSPALREQFSERLRVFFPQRAFQLRFNNNSSTVISLRERYGRLELSLHHMFIEAGPAVLAALAEYLRGSRAGASVLEDFIEQNRDRLDRSRRSEPQPRGRRFDLEGIRDALGRAYFGGPVQVPIGWGVDRRAARRRARSIRLGSYSFEDGVVRIHPALDQDFVPPCVVVFVVYHELLHFVLGAVRRGSRRLVHTREFRERERRFVHHERAVRWEAANLDRLLGRPRPKTRKPRPG